jgi:hypothetical protein
MTAIGQSVVLAAGEGRRVGVALDTLTFKGAGAEDRFSVVEYEAAAGMPGPPVHVHHGNEEAFCYEQLVEELGAILPHNAPPDEAAVAALFAQWDTEIVVQAGS